MSILYALICSDYGLWEYPVWWIFTNNASVLFQAVILFPSSTVLFLRYLPRNRWFVTLYIFFFVVLYIMMEWFMIKRGEIRYGHGWNLGWSMAVVVFMFVTVLLHESNKKLTWLFSIVIITFLISWFDVPLLAL